MGDSINSDDLPSSPWATRYPVTKFTFTSKKARHSYFAPDYPRINDPKYYDQDPDPVIIVHPHSDEEIDKVLWSEMIQRAEFWGMRTWEAAALNRHLRFSPETGFISGGHRLVDGMTKGLPGVRIPPRTSSLGVRRTLPAILSANQERDYTVYENERIQVNESEWFPFLRRGRWFDWIHVDPRHSKARYTAPGLGPEPKTWSVDDPKVWEVLSVSIDLVDRILKALLSDENQGLRTMIYGRWEYWDKFIDIFGEPPDKDTSVLLDYATELKISEKRGDNICEWSQTVDKSVRESYGRLIHLLSLVAWSFLDSGSTNGITFNDPISDPKKPEYTSLITLSTNKLETLLDPDITLGERCTLQFDLAVVMVHELMHAILAARYKFDDYEGNCLEKERSGRPIAAEPFLNAQGIAEAGHFMENVFFGGIFLVEPESSGYPERPHPPPLIQAFRNWPYAGYTSKPAAPDSDFKKDGYINVSQHATSTWISKILSDSFWHDEAFPRKSENFFHRNPLFILENKKLPGYSERRINGEVLAADLTTLKYRYDEDEIAIEDWNTRLRTWDNARELWYDEALKKWGSTPWGHGEEREVVPRFEKAFLSKDIIRSAKIANWFISQINWNKDVDTYVTSLPAEGFESSDWVWHCIGLLMMASIPLRGIVVSRQAAPSTYMTEHVPSKQAASNGHAKTVYIVRQDSPGKPEYTRPNIFYNRFRVPDRAYKDITQFDYLQLVDDVIKVIAYRNGDVHLNLLNAIKSAKDAIHADRTQLSQDYPGAHVTRWSSRWFFEFPAYSPALCSFVNGAWVIKD
ncbi:hypothetical protein GGR58DRAFT_488285 [Xylaria digitata]|nr:hypothetical protein GGR58DRAFT_488285 [Xylaria digitata]